MPTTAQDVHTRAVRALPPAERLRLAALILDEPAGAEVAVVDAKDDWDADDRRDVTAFAMKHAAVAYPEDEDLV